MSTLIGISRTESESGRCSTTLHLASDFDEYFNNPEAGRFCEGQKTESVYVGAFDCSKLKIGQHIDIMYGKAVTTAKGTFQPIKRIDILTEK